MKQMRVPHVVRFMHAQPDSFLNVVRLRVKEEMQRQGISPYANRHMIAKSCFLLISCFSLYLVMLFIPLSMALYLVLCGLIGFNVACIGFNITHDALHQSYSSSLKVNRVLGYLFDLIGASSFVWKTTHNVRHHTYTNIPGYDEDIDKAILLRLAPTDPWRYFHRFQGIYAFFLYCLLGTNWIYYSDYAWVKREWNTHRPTSLELFLLIFFKVLHVIWLICIPLLFFSWEKVLMGYLVMQIIGSFTLAIVFQLAHIVDCVSYGYPNPTGTVENQWVLHEMATTSNFATQNTFITWLIGGLNYQIEHHLFPHICHVHYPALIAPLVKKTAEEFGITYHVNPTLWDAMKSHYRRLKQLGNKESLETVLKPKI